MKLPFARFFIVLSGCLFNLVSGFRWETPDDADLSTLQIIEKYGYPGESHLIQTEDGYIIQIHRIPYGKNHYNGNDTTPGKPFLLLHGLFGSSETFLLLGESSLAFDAADRGYDVWLGNVRGNHYGKLHRKLAMHTTDFWDFSWHETGIYDLSAQIDYICNYTQYDKIMLLGYSLGNSAFLVLTSLRQDYQEKIQGAVLMAPVTTFKPVRLFFRLLSPAFKILSRRIQKGEVAKYYPILQKLLDIWCFLSKINTIICKKFAHLSFGSNPSQLTEEGLHKIFGQGPSSTSLKMLMHAWQVALSGKFQQYDYGCTENIVRYESSEPPEYDLSSINTPVSMFFATNDNLINREEYEFLVTRLPNIKSVDIVDSVEFNHLDFGVGRDACTKAYPKLLKMVDELAYGSHSCERV